MFLSIEEIDRFIKEDVPYIDLTSWSLGIRGQIAKISYFTREDAVVCGTEEVRMIFERLGIEAGHNIPSGERVGKGGELISGTGSGDNIHMAWKVGQNILEHCSGIATKTEKMVRSARKCNPNVAVLTTRKGFPGTKALAVKAVMAGGAAPHRLGISETILIFKQHIEFIGGFEALLAKINEIKRDCCEKKIIVEATGAEEAKKLCAAGADGIQFDKLPPSDLKEAVAALRDMFANVIFLAAGGINENNIAEYAATNVDGIVTTSLYNAKPIDIGVNIKLL